MADVPEDDQVPVGDGQDPPAPEEDSLETAPPEEDAPDAVPTAARPAAPASPRPAAAGARGLFKRDMERQEQLMSFAAAGLAVVLGIVGALSTHTPTHGSKAAHTASPGVILALACGLGVVLWLTARHGSRVATALVAMALFITAFGGSVLGIPYVVLGGWLLIRNSRSMRDQRQAAQRAGGSGAGRGARPARGGAAAGGGNARAPRETRQARRVRREAEAAEARRIEANKRYTPPAPRRRRPGR